jgi:hypothetical protein
LCVKGIWTKFMGGNYPPPRLNCSFRFEVLHSGENFKNKSTGRTK